MDHVYVIVYRSYKSIQPETNLEDEFIKDI